MLSNGISKITLLILTIQWAKSQPKKTETINKTAPEEWTHNNELGNSASNNWTHDRGLGNYVELHDGDVSKDYESDQFDDVHLKQYVHTIRVVRSDRVSKNVNITGVVRPNTRLNRSRTMTSKSGRDQVHVFFADKAREDAYQKTEAEEQPYSVVFRAHADDGVSICSGTLVTVRWVLTAAHCLADAEVTSVDVFAGITFNIFGEHIPDPLPVGAQVRVSEEFYANPKYEPKPINADFDNALIAIDPPFETSKYVKPIPVATTPWNYRGLRKCKLTAFGSVRSDKDSPDDFIRKTQLLAVEKPCKCDKTLREKMGAGPASRYICMKPVPDFGICSGDSGGGLVCDGEVKAVVSFSIKMPDLTSCKRRTRFGRSDGIECGDVDAISVFQDVYPSLSWIKKNAFRRNASDTNGSNGANQWIKFTFSVFCSLLCLYVGLNNLK